MLPYNNDNPFLVVALYAPLIILIAIPFILLKRDWLNSHPILISVITLGIIVGAICLALFS